MGPFQVTQILNPVYEGELRVCLESADGQKGLVTFPRLQGRTDAEVWERTTKERDVFFAVQETVHFPRVLGYVQQIGLPFFSIIRETFGRPLSCCLQERKFTLPEVRLITFQLLCSLKTLHERRIRHGHLSLDDVEQIHDGFYQIVRADHAVLSDMPTIPSYDEDGPWSPPEVRLRAGGYSEAIDMWALGALVVHLVAGKTFPFSLDLNVQCAIWTEYLGQLPQWLQEIAGPALAAHNRDTLCTYLQEDGLITDFVRRLMHPDPGMRLTAQTALSHPWMHPRSPLFDKPTFLALHALSTVTLHSTRYRITHYLGNGAFGVVYAAHYVHGPACPVAIKIARVFQEVHVLKPLKHEGIVEIIDFGMGNAGSRRNQIQMAVFERLGISLYDELMQKKEAYSLEEIQQVGKAVLQVLYYLHAERIVHADIKPANILWDYSHSRLKLIDFGHAQKNLSRYLCTRNLVTSYYRPPEIWFNTQRYTSAIDMWALGCVLAELFLKEPLFPFKDEDLVPMAKTFAAVLGPIPVELYRKALCLDLTPADGASPLRERLQRQGPPSPLKEAFIELIESLLRYSPQERPSSFDALSKSRFFTMESAAAREYESVRH